MSVIFKNIRMISSYMTGHDFLLSGFIRITNQTAVNDSLVKSIMRIQLSSGTKFFITLIAFEIVYTKMLLEMCLVVILTNITIGAIFASV